MSEKKPLYDSPGEKGKRWFEDLECYQLALEVMAKVHAFPRLCLPMKSLICTLKSVARGELNETLARLIDAKVLGYIDQPDFEELHKLIRQAEQTLNGYMNYVRRQQSGSQEFGDIAIHEYQADYDIS